MVTVAGMDKLLAPGVTGMASFDKILALGGTTVESDYQFADREDESGGEVDRVATSTAAK